MTGWLYFVALVQYHYWPNYGTDGSRPLHTERNGNETGTYKTFIQGNLPLTLWSNADHSPWTSLLDWSFRRPFLPFSPVKTLPSLVLLFRGRELGGSPRAVGEHISTDELKQHDCDQKPLCTPKNGLNWSTLKFFAIIFFISFEMLISNMRCISLNCKC